MYHNTFFRFVSSAVYYGMNFNVANLAGDRYLNALVSGLVEIPALILVVCVNNRWGRRKTVACLMLVAGLFSFSILIIDMTGKTKIHVRKHVKVLFWILISKQTFYCCLLGKRYETFMWL